MNRLILNEISYFGAGSRRMIVTEAVSRGFKKAFFVTDKSMIKLGMASKVEKVLNEGGIPYNIFSDFSSNPTVANVQSGVAAFKTSGADFIIALGDGSCINAAKAIGIVVANPGFSDVKSLEGVTDTKNKAIPAFVLLTTTSPVAEVTISGVIIDEKTYRKMVYVNPNSIPVVAIVDSELTCSIPRDLTAANGMDALTHAIENYIMPGAWTMSNIFELKAIEMIAQHLKMAVDNGRNLVAREAMAQAQYIAGMGFSNTGQGLVHSMAYSLEAFYDIPHGVANAVLLPYVMEYNTASPAASKYINIARAMGVNTAGVSQEDSIEYAIGAVKILSMNIHLPQKLREIGVKKTDIYFLAISAFNNISTEGNPRPVSLEDIETLYRKAY